MESFHWSDLIRGKLEERNVKLNGKYSLFVYKLWFKFKIKILKLSFKITVTSHFERCRGKMNTMIVKKIFLRRRCCSHIDEFRPRGFSAVKYDFFFFFWCVCCGSAETGSSISTPLTKACSRKKNRDYTFGKWCIVLWIVCSITA